MANRTRNTVPGPAIDANIIVNALTTAVLVIDAGGLIRQVNTAAEQLFDSSRVYLCDCPLSDFVPEDSPLFYLIRQARMDGADVSEHGVFLDTPRTGARTVTIRVTPLVEMTGWVMVALQEHSIAIKMGQHMTHRSAARSVAAMAAMLAHEVKNPLSGIRGAAQLLEQNASLEDRALTQLICDEADRIVALVNRMDVFSDHRPLERDAVNIHRVLEHVRRVSENGFAQKIRFVEAYDPSLPPVFGNRDQLIQIFLNLIKNAAEAVQEGRGEILLSTAYQQGVRVAVPGTNTRMHLPLVVSVQDNGAGIPEDLWPHLFDAFVTTKPTGSGLGLALVAKIVNDHGGLIEFDSQPGRTIFRVMLPIVVSDSGL
ncbi:MAG: PAS domain-containing protein [Alphaproteobacteria bacterium]|nr:PAS domain-containing protein [Alphaproteobacteria bacterium]